MAASTKAPTAAQVAKQERLNVLASITVAGHRQAQAPEVKAWGANNGFTVSTVQGRLANALIDAFNARGDKLKNPVQYVVGTKTKVEEAKTYAYTTAAGRKGKFTALPSAVRAHSVANGGPATGRFSQETLDAYGQAQAAARKS